MFLKLMLSNEPFLQLECFVPASTGLYSLLICLVERNLTWLSRDFSLVISGLEDFSSSVYINLRMIVLDIDGHRKSEGTMDRVGHTVRTMPQKRRQTTHIRD